ncbi:prohead core protein [Acidovorax phage ACP17]|uniref:Prohead core protein n=1 Tax=Acidovorax phage ACP17 TaxID=2010329 RepID=A0A218M2V4_9CAUD|nr:prohead core protein [Acidovorax phage ACP17]ASD50376.1 prohead core protein [Acidovorax phage ACP17]
MIQVLTEEFEAQNIIQESKDEAGRPAKNYFLEGICIQSNIKNRNGRLYPKALVDREVNRYITEMVATNRAVGELNHPEARSSIDYERVSHKYVSLTESGNNWIGRAQVTTGTPMGSIVAGLMDCGVVMGTSSRANGTTRLHEGVKVVQNDFRLVTPGDIVSDPSAPDAFLTGLMENKEWVYGNGVLFEREVEMKDKVNTLARTKQLNEQSMKNLFGLIMTMVKEKN